MDKAAGIESGSGVGLCLFDLANFFFFAHTKYHLESNTVVASRCPAGQIFRMLVSKLY